MDPRLFFRKLWHPDMVARWDAWELTSQHPHGEPPEWAALRQQGVQHVNQYPYQTHAGKGKALPSAVERYVALCVHPPATLWANLNPADKLTILEQAGVFAYPNPADAHWYGGAAVITDIFVAFYGVQLCPGPEPRSVLSPVIKKVAKLTRQEFVDQYFGGNPPPQPQADVAHGDQQIIHDAPGTGLVGDDDDEDYGEMPDIRPND